MSMAINKPFFGTCCHL